MIPFIAEPTFLAYNITPERGNKLTTLYNYGAEFDVYLTMTIDPNLDENKKYNVFRMSTYDYEAGKYGYRYPGLWWWKEDGLCPSFDYLKDHNFLTLCEKVKYGELIHVRMRHYPRNPGDNWADWIFEYCVNHVKCQTYYTYHSEWSYYSSSPKLWSQIHVHFSSPWGIPDAMPAMIHSFGVNIGSNKIDQKSPFLTMCETSHF